MNKKSFTLIELLVVIAIIGILSSLVIARFSDWGDNARIANTLQWSAGVHRTLGANLVGHWPLNGNIKDVSGNNNDITMSGFEGEYWEEGVSGIENQSLKFNGIDWNILDYNIGGYTPSDDFTFSLWVNFNELTIGGLMISGHTVGSYGFERRNDRIIFGSRVINEDDITKSITYFPRTGKWYLFTGIHNGSNEKLILYINGKYNNETTIGDIGGSYVNEDIETGSSDRLCGSGSLSEPLFGLISDVRIYNTALTVEEVSRIYAETKDKYLVYE